MSAATESDVDRNGTVYVLYKPCQHPARAAMIEAGILRPRAETTPSIDHEAFGWKVFHIVRPGSVAP